MLFRSNPLHLIGFNFSTLHGIHFIQSCFIATTAFNREPLGHAAWNPLHSMTLHGIHCITRDAFYHAPWNPLHSVTLHGIHCSQSGSIVPHCRENTAFNRDPLHHTALTPLHSIEINWAMLHRIHCIQSGSI